MTGLTPTQVWLLFWACLVAAAALGAHEYAKCARINRVRDEMRRDLEAHFADALNLARNDNPLSLCRTPEDFVFAGAVLADIDDLGGVA